MGEDSVFRRRMRRGVCVVLLMVLGAGCAIFRGSSTPLGVEMYGTQRYLIKEGRRLGDEGIDEVDRIVDQVARSISQGAAGGALQSVGPLSDELPDIAQEALPLARKKVERYAETRPDFVESLDRFRAEEIQFEWSDESIASESFHEGNASLVMHSTHLEDPDLPPLEPGKSFYARVYARAEPWPRKEGYVPHPELVLAQSTVVWHSRTLAARMLAQALAEVLAERVAKRIDLAAGDQGLEASRDQVPR